MATVDNTIYLKTGETKVVVCNPANLPTAKEFMEAFKVTQKKSGIDQQELQSISHYCLKFDSTLLNSIAMYGAIFKRQTST
eukprot:5404967-Ditylum_brightwellii.AAC.1